MRSQTAIASTKSGIKQSPNVHLAHEAILVHALPLVTLRLLGPHFLHVLQYHVAVSVKSLDTGQELTIVAAGDQDLSVCAGSGLQEGERAGGELVLLDESDLIFPVAMRDARLVLRCMYDFGGMHRNVRLVGRRCGRHGLPAPRSYRLGRSSKGEG